MGLKNVTPQYLNKRMTILIDLEIGNGAHKQRLGITKINKYKEIEIKISFNINHVIRILFSTVKPECNL